MIFRAVRQNLFLKLISLAAAIVLYFYVQTQRNPQVSAILQAKLILRPELVNIDAIPASSNIKVQVTGPHLLVDNLKDGDVVAIAYVNGNIPNNGDSRNVRLRYDVPSLRADAMSQVRIDGPTSERVTFYSLAHRLVPVQLPHFNAQSSIVYRDPAIDPAQVTVSGHSQLVHRVAHVVVTGLPTQAGDINTSCNVIAMDDDGDIVDGITLVPPQVHINTLALPISPMHIATVSADIINLPVPPYRLTSVTVSPLQVKVTVKPGVTLSSDVISTAPISLQAATGSYTATVPLEVPKGVSVADLHGQQITSVHVHVEIAQTPPLPLPADKHPAKSKPATSSALPNSRQTSHQPSSGSAPTHDTSPTP